MAEVQGTCDARLEPVRQALAARIDAGDELGASIAVDIDGELIGDLWGGWADAERTRPWEHDTITNVWSTTKMVTNLCALMLVDRGQLDVDAPVADYWPEFGAAGKDGVLVRHVLSHTSGVSGWEPPFTLQEMYDHDVAVAHLAAQTPWWEPGSVSGYHAANQGHLVAELIRRTDGRGLRAFVAEELAGPMGADFQIGAAEEDWSRIAPVVPPPPLPIDLSTLDPSSAMMKTLGGPVTDAAVANTPAWRRAEMGAVNGHANARSVATILRAISLGGTVDDVELLSPETIDLIFREQSHSPDLVLGIPLRFGIGYALPEDVTVPYAPASSCYWGGWGGSITIMDPATRTTISYVMNAMAPGIIGSDRSEEYATTIQRCLA